MSNLSRLLLRYQEAELTQQLNTVLQQASPARILLEKSVGAQISFVLTASYFENPCNHILVVADKEEAAYFQNTLDALLGDQAVLFFPDSFKQAGNFEELRSTQVMQRTEVMNKMSLGLHKGEILVTYPEALFEKVVSPEQLKKKRIEIVKTEEMDIEFLLELLIEFGFERVDFVYEPGQFSIRGGIVDIFSYGSEWPYRIELFDNEVESIRTFNPSTQLSLKNIARISIIPDVHQKFEATEKISLLQAFKGNTVIWISDLDLVLDKLQQCFELTEEIGSNIGMIEDENLKSLFREKAFLYPREVISDLGEAHTVLLRKSQIKMNFDLERAFKSTPQPSFNKNFNLLIEDLRQLEEKRYECFLFTENNKQVERFYKIFEDLQANVNFHPIIKAIHAGFIDHELQLACYTDHQIFERFHRYRLRKGFSKEQAISLRMIRELQPGDFVVHIDHGVGRYSGLEKIDINGHIQESIRLFYKNNDVLYVSINSLHKISKYVGKDGTAPQLDKIGSDRWKSVKRKTKRKVKDIAKELIQLYAKRRAAEGFAFEEDGYLQNELEASFIYEDTPDQLTATNMVKEDMMKENPMDRLICGDVGFGKTEVAIRAAFKAVVSGKQVGILVPTTILAIQHYHTFSDRLKEFGVKIDYLNRFKTSAEKTQIYKKLESGEIEIIIGTHALLNQRVKFKDIGLLVIDEEQKFGVAAKEKLRKMKVNVDTLTLTATPIPRTLQFSLMAARDLSIIKTAPPNRQPIHTERRTFSDEVIKDAIYYEINRGGQVFFVHNRVKSLPDIGGMIARLCPDADIAMAHGQMESKILEKTLLDFIEGRFDVLVCTNIIETGLDIPNANTIIINNAHQFGMSDLHQLRGRVGRSNKKAFCYLFAPPLSVLTSDARKRIQTLEDFSELGSGFHIAMRDLDIRGAGNLLGAEQSGFISDIGYETYQKILEEAILELKENEFKDLFKEDLEKERSYVREVEIDTDIEMLIPDDYINNIQERLNMYTILDSLENEDQLSAFRKNLKDRFGDPPREMEELFHGLRLRWMCRKMGFERLSLKKKKMRCYFISNAQSSYYETAYFKGLLAYISKDGHRMQLTLKQSAKFLILIKDGVRNLKEAKIILERIQEDLALMA